MHKENLDKKKLRMAEAVTFLMGFSQAILLYVMSSYFELASGTENVGGFYTLAYIIFLIVLFNFHKLVRLVGKSGLFYFSLLAKLAILFFLVSLNPSQWSIFLMMLYIILGHIEWVALDTIVESFSVDRMSGRIRGMHLTIASIGYLCGPFISTFILERAGFHGVFLLTLILNCFIFIISLVSFRQVNHKFDQKLGVIDVFRKTLRRKNILRIYYIALALDFFFALMTIYMPMYLHHLGYSWEKIGIIFTIMLVPFVLVQYPMGALADKKTGEKEFIIFSLILIGLSTLSVYIVGDGTVLVWSILLFCTRIGAALLEILRDSYFFKQVDAYDVDIIGLFRTSLPMAYILATAFSTIILLFFPIKTIFILAVIVAFFALMPAFSLIDNEAEREMSK